MAGEHPVWGHRKIWAMVRHEGHRLSPSTVLRIMADEGLLLHAGYQEQRRDVAKQRKSAFAAPPTGPNQVWQFDLSEYENHWGRDLAGRRRRGLLLEGRVRLALVTHREPARRHRRCRTCPRAGRGHARRHQAHRSPD